jgi:hypothetical protein
MAFNVVSSRSGHKMVTIFEPLHDRIESTGITTQRNQGLVINLKFFLILDLKCRYLLRMKRVKKIAIKQQAKTHPKSRKKNED